MRHALRGGELSHSVQVTYPLDDFLSLAAHTIPIGYVEAWMQLALSLRSSGDVAGAMTALETAIQIRPEYADLWKTLPPDPTIPELQRTFPIRQPLLWVTRPKP